jgi:hypothetical protein
MSAHIGKLLIAALIVMLVSPVAGAAGLTLSEDGWYRWEVAAGGGGRNACCYRFSLGAVTHVGCRLGGGAMGRWVSGDCEIRSDALQIYVERRGGEVVEIQAFSSGCPVETESPVRDLPQVTTEQSIDWLLEQVDAGASLREEALMAISFHVDQAALEALRSVLEDRGRDRKTREQALFWLIQSDSDLAYAYLDRLLG